MLHAVRHYAALTLGLLITGLVGGWASGLFETARGAAGPTALHAAAPAVALIGLLLCLAVGTVLGIVVARVTNAAVGLFVSGWGVAVLAMRTETVDELVHAQASLGLLPLETVLWFLLIAASVIAVFRFGGRLSDIQPKDDDQPEAWYGAAGWRAAAGGLVLIPIVLLLVRSPMQGQVIGSLFVAGMAAGMVGRLLSPHVQPVILFASPVLVGAIAQVVGLVMLKGDPHELLAADSFPALLRPMPADLAAGALAGVSVGLGMIKSVLHEEQDETASQKTSPAASS